MGQRISQKEMFDKYKQYVCPICANKQKEDSCDIRIIASGDARCCNFARIERNEQIWILQDVC